MKYSLYSKGTLFFIDSHISTWYHQQQKISIQIETPLSHHVGWCHTWLCLVPNWIASWPFRCSAVHSAKGTALQPKPTDAVLNLLLQDEENCKPRTLQGRAGRTSQKIQMSTWSVYIWFMEGIVIIPTRSRNFRSNIGKDSRVAGALCQVK